MVKFRTVVLSCGSVRGVELMSNLGKLYVSFKGVPYAKPPVGTLRFKPPQPVEPWTHVRDAIKEGNRAPHFDMVSKEFCGSEDCLYLNIYTPQVPETDGFSYKPVMFWIHGGGYAFGHADSDVYGPDLLVQQDVVLVTVNYRLGVLGFLNLELDGASGNMGLKDQVAALRWVKKEIKAFGGDSNNITIFGNSAGGASVHLHMLSNMSKGLFQKAIAQSGNALCNWAFTTEHKKRAFLLGKLLGFESENPEELLKFFHTITPLEFATNQDSIMTKTHHLKGIDQAFVPSIEKSHCDEQVFISEHPKALLQKGQFDEKIPFVTGITSDEGISMIFAIKKFPWFLHELNSKFESFFPSGELYQEKVDKIKKLYFSKDIINEESRNIIDFFTDSSFLLPAYESVLLQSRTGQQIFFYEFKHDGKFGWYKRLMSKHRNMKQTEIPQGVCHGDELGYLFTNNILGVQDFKSSSDIIVAQNITKLWSNFARTGVPEIPDCSASWIPVLDEDFNCLSIGENITNVCPGFKKRVDFWTEIGATTSADY